MDNASMCLHRTNHSKSSACMAGCLFLFSLFSLASFLLFFFLFGFFTFLTLGVLQTWTITWCCRTLWYPWQYS